DYIGIRLSCQLCVFHQIDFLPRCFITSSSMRDVQQCSIHLAGSERTRITSGRFETARCTENASVGGMASAVRTLFESISYGRSQECDYCFRRRTKAARFP